MRSFDVYTRPLRRSTDFSGLQTAVLFVVFALVASIPVITHPVPPLTDYVNHLARVHVIATIGTDSDLSRFYEIDWQIIPNLMMDLVIPQLERFMSVYHAGQVFTVATFVLILSGTVALNRALFGSWSVLPLVAFPLLYNHVFLVGVMTYMFGLGLALWALAAIAAAAIGWAARHRLLRLHPVGWLLLAIASVVYLAMPRVVFATYMADQRLPIAAAFMILACAQLDLHHRLVRREFLALLLVLLVVRVIEVDVNWAELSRETLEFRDSVKRIKRGSTVLVAYADRSAGEDVRELNLVHAACLAMIERSALVTTAFTVPGKQIMHVRPQYAAQVDTEDGTPPALDQLMLAIQHHGEAQSYWELWPNRFDYIYVLFTDEDTRNPAPELLTLVHEGERFRLYKVNKERTAVG